MTPQDDAAARAWSIMGDLVLDNERRREVSDALGLPFGRVRALRRIAASPMTMGELAATLGAEKPYATIVVDELERQGLVERRPHPTDRRVKLVATTPGAPPRPGGRTRSWAGSRPGWRRCPSLEVEELARISRGGGALDSGLSAGSTRGAGSTAAPAQLV